MGALNFELIIKNTYGSKVVEICEKLIVSEIGNGFISVLSENPKKGEKKGIGFCYKNAAIDWLSKNHIDEEFFSVGDEVRVKNRYLIDKENIEDFHSYVIEEILDVSSLELDFAMVHLSGLVAARMSNGEKPWDIYKCSQLLKLSAGGHIMEEKSSKRIWFRSVKFTKAPL
jgi:hypothetical protein